jgi:hypothetical protein
VCVYGGREGLSKGKLQNTRITREGDGRNGYIRTPPPPPLLPFVVNAAFQVINGKRQRERRTERETDGQGGVLGRKKTEQTTKQSGEGGRVSNIARWGVMAAVKVGDREGGGP